MLDTGRLDLERPDAIAGGDDHVVAAAGVPHVAVLVHESGVLAVEPLAAERLTRLVLVPPVAERVVRVRARAETDLTALAARHLLLVLVEDPDVPPGHRPSHRALADLHPREVRAQRIRLGQAVVVENGETVFVSE